MIDNFAILLSTVVIVYVIVRATRITRTEAWFETIPPEELRGIGMARRGRRPDLGAELAAETARRAARDAAEGGSEQGRLPQGPPIGGGTPGMRTPGARPPGTRTLGARPLGR